MYLSVYLMYSSTQIFIFNIFSKIFLFMIHKTVYLILQNVKEREKTVTPKKEIISHRKL